MYVPVKNSGGSRPPNFGYKQKPRKPRKATIFPWRRDPEGRIVLVYLGLMIESVNPHWRSDRKFGGELPGSLAWKESLVVKSYFPELYKRVEPTCNPPDFSGFVHKIYERQNKSTTGKDYGSSTHNEHFRTWKKDPVTKEELAKAESMITDIIWG